MRFRRAIGPASRDFLGHPPGLAVLFATESWERFSYFGNAALVVLYMRQKTWMAVHIFAESVGDERR